MGISTAIWKERRRLARQSYDAKVDFYVPLTPANLIAIRRRIAGMLLDAELAEAKIIPSQSRSAEYHAETAAWKVAGAIHSRRCLRDELRALRNAVSADWMESAA